MDKLTKMVQRQIDLQNHLGIDMLSLQKSPKLRQHFINQMMLAVHEEAVEAMRETAYKNPAFVRFGWKKHQPYNQEKFQNEIIDLWHFLLNLSIISGMTAKDIYDKYMIKSQENKNRKDDGY